MKKITFNESVLLIVILVLLLVVISVESATIRKPLVEPIKNNHFILDASIYGKYYGNPNEYGKIKWFDTGIEIKKGMTFSIKATGLMIFEGYHGDSTKLYGYCEPNGLDDKVYLFKDGRLMGRVIKNWNESISGATYWGNIQNNKYKREYYFGIDKNFTQRNIQHEGRLELNISPPAWVDGSGNWVAPCGKYQVSVYIEENYAK